MDKKVEEQLREDTEFLSCWLDDLDARLMREVIEPDDTLYAAFKYFDSAPWKPLNPRELLGFWGSLTPFEVFRVLVEIERGRGK